MLYIFGNNEFISRKIRTVAPRGADLGRFILQCSPSLLSSAISPLNQLSGSTPESWPIVAEDKPVTMPMQDIFMVSWGRPAKMRSPSRFTFGVSRHD